VTSWSLVQRIPNDYGASLFVIKAHHEWGDPGSPGAVGPKTNKICFWKHVTAC
jgi:hypothetical protein